MTDEPVKPTPVGSNYSEWRRRIPVPRRTAADAAVPAASAGFAAWMANLPIEAQEAADAAAPILPNTGGFAVWIVACPNGDNPVVKRFGDPLAAVEALAAYRDQDIFAFAFWGELLPLLGDPPRFLVLPGETQVAELTPAGVPMRIASADAAHLPAQTESFYFGHPAYLELGYIRSTDDPLLAGRQPGQPRPDQRRGRRDKPGDDRDDYDDVRTPG